MKHRHQREYSRDELAVFAEYVQFRAAARPAECHYGAGCWVTEGPPACNTNGGADSRCSGCGGSIKWSR